jgi:hypothetical protein
LTTFAQFVTLIQCGESRRSSSSAHVRINILGQTLAAIVTKVSVSDSGTRVNTTVGRTCNPSSRHAPHVLLDFAGILVPRQKTSLCKGGLRTLLSARL